MAEHYEVFRQEDTSVLTESGQPALGYRIYFRIPQTGTVSHIDITIAEFTPEEVAKRIEEVVNKVLAVFEL